MQSVKFFRPAFLLILMRSWGGQGEITISAAELRVLITYLGLFSQQVVEPGLTPKFSDCGEKEADVFVSSVIHSSLPLFKGEPKHFTQTQSKFPSFQKSSCVRTDPVLWWESRLSLQGSARLRGFSTQLRYSWAVWFRHLPISRSQLPHQSGRLSLDLGRHSELLWFGITLWKPFMWTTRLQDLGTEGFLKGHLINFFPNCYRIRSIYLLILVVSIYLCSIYVVSIYLF